MDKRKYTPPHPWDDGIYGTGPTQPPKNHGGLIALLLILVILLSGISGILGVMNVRLFNRLNSQPQEQQPLRFSYQAPGEDAASHIIGEATEPNIGSRFSMDLHKSPQSTENVPQEGALSWQDVYIQNLPSVVSVSGSDSQCTTNGTGVVLTQNGYIVTNAHVVSGAKVITVQLSDGSDFPALLIGADEVTDLAVVYVEAGDLTPAVFGDSEALRVGDPVAAIGDPLGMQFHGSMTDGIISAINRNIAVNGRNMTLIQTSATLNPGNSGGPLINCYGQVVGINALQVGVFVTDPSVEGIGFAIPSATVKDVVEQLMEQGYVSGRPTLGLEGESVSSFNQHYYHMPPGLYITAVSPASDAARKGVDAGDILIRIDGQSITGPEDLKQALYTHGVNDRVQVVIYRAGKEYTLELTLSEFKG